MTAGERLRALSGLTGVSAGEHLRALAAGLTAGAILVAYSGLAGVSASTHLLYDPTPVPVEIKYDILVPVSRVLLFVPESFNVKVESTQVQFMVQSIAMQMAVPNTKVTVHLGSIPTILVWKE